MMERFSINGLIDEVQIYNIALPSTDIASLLGGPSIGPNTDIWQRGDAGWPGRTSTSVQRNTSLTSQLAGPLTLRSALNNLLTYTLAAQPITGLMRWSEPLSPTCSLPV